MAEEKPEGTAPAAPDRTAAPDRAAPDRAAADRERLALEKKRERYVWYYLGYFLFGIHIVAFVMIYAVRHAK
ncbi:hypothetical protein ACWEL8_05120 [Streptomyces sp. NPDC004690]